MAMAVNPTGAVLMLTWLSASASIYFPEADVVAVGERQNVTELAGAEPAPEHGIQFSEEEALAGSFVPSASVWQAQLDNIIARGVLQFGIELDRTLWAASESAAGDAVYSPLSVVGALALVLLGSAGRTHTEVATLLGLTAGVDLSGSRADLFHEHLGRQLARLVARPGVDTETAVAVASAVFVQQGFPLRRQFVGLAREAYHSEVLSLSFKTRPEEAQVAVNSWVERETRGKIRDFLAFPPLPETVLIIGSAIYFNGAWETPFPLSHSMKRPFYVTGEHGSAVAPEDEVLEVTMMTNAADLPYAVDAELGCSILGLPYRGGEAVMYVVLPDEMGHRGLRELEQKLSAPVLEHLIAATNTTPVIVLLPRMTLEVTTSLREPLETLGLHTLFDAKAANLSALSPAAGLSVDDVLHKVRVEVTETGTVAAAATALSITRDGSRPVFRADHPFLFFIHHRTTRLVMFWGRVLRPSPYTVRQAPAPPS